jgi:hypothetical protein
MKRKMRLASQTSIDVMVVEVGVATAAKVVAVVRDAVDAIVIVIRVAIAAVTVMTGVAVGATEMTRLATTTIVSHHTSLMTKVTAQVAVADVVAIVVVKAVGKVVAKVVAKVVVSDNASRGSRWLLIST